MKKILIIILVLCFSVLTFLQVDYLLLASTQNEQSSSYATDQILLNSSLFTQTNDESIYVQPTINFDDFEQVVENNNLILYTSKKSGAIRIYNKTTGYYWTSDITDEELLATQNNNTVKTVKSSFNLVYRNESGSVKNVRTMDAGVTLTYKVSGNEVTYNVSMTKLGISFKYVVTLNDTNVKVRLDHESIKEGNNVITSITLFPYFGGVYEDSVPGYLFLPSGTGALIRYDKKSTINSIYSTSFYGNDANITTNDEGDILNLPIYGMVHGINQNACLIEINQGDTFAKLNYSPSSIGLNYHLLYSTFNYRETYTLKMSTGESVFMVPDEMYDSDVELTYTFLSNEDANYVGMAKYYQEKLVSEGTLEKNSNNKQDIGLEIEAFGRDYEQGLIVKKYYNMTTTKDILNINKTLTSNGINQIFYVLRAFNKGGYSAARVNKYGFDTALGKLSDLDELETYFYYNPVESYNSSKKYPNNVLVNLYRNKNYITVSTNKYKFYSNVSSIINYTPKVINKYNGKVVLDGIGYRLYGDSKNNLTRSETLNSLVKMLGDNKLIMYAPNYYLLGNTSKYLNMSLYAERLRFFTDSVPFLPIVLSGYMEYYSTYLNFSSNRMVDMLKCIEYGIYPAYVVTNKESYELADTLASNFYATTFNTIVDNIISQYQKINSALKEVIGATIINHQVLKLGVYEVEYSNGKKIIVNYTSDSYTYQSHQILGMDYKVI